MEREGCSLGERGARTSKKRTNVLSVKARHLEGNFMFIYLQGRKKHAKE